MNFRKLLTYFAFGTAAVMPFAGAQNPTILQGNYITNVFGNSNFVLNPNAQTNIANVTVSNATVTRSTSTPLVATSEFLVTTSTATGSATWSTRTFDGGMKGQNCEARFTYRGFSVGSTTAQILQGANVVAQLTLTASTDPRIASINFPCGDLSSATTFRLQQATASLTGTNEIGGIYVGLATNMANVAQATKVGGFDSVSCSAEASLTTGTAGTWYTPNVAGTCTGTAVGLASAASSNLNTLTLAFNNLPVGEYLLMLPAYVAPQTVAGARCDGRVRETSLNAIDGQNAFAWATTGQAYGVGQINQFKFTNTTTANRTFQIEFMRNGGTTWNCNGGFISTGQNVSLYRFPSSSELVVKPETQPWYISAVVSGGLPALGTANVSLSEITNATLNLTPESGSQPVATLCSGTNAPPTASTSATTCAVGDESVGITFTPPSVGSYEVCAEFSTSVQTSTGGQSDVTFAIQETATNNNVALTTYSGTANAGFSVPNITYNNQPVNICQIVQVNSLGQKAYRLFRTTTVSGTITTNVIIANDSQGKRNLRWKVTPVTNQSNSALYVQGPVLGAQTGAAIPSGYVGQLILLTLGTDKALTSSNTYASLTTQTIPAGVWMLHMSAYAQWGTSQPVITRIGMRLNKTSGTGTVDTLAGNGNFFISEMMWPSALSVYRTDVVGTPLQVTSDGTMVLTYEYILNGTTAGNNRFDVKLVRIN